MILKLSNTPMQYHIKLYVLLKCKNPHHDKLYLLNKKLTEFCNDYL